MPADRVITGEDSLPLTVPVAVVVVEALQELDSLTRNESYLLERLRTADDPTAALLRAIKDVPDA